MATIDELVRGHERPAVTVGGVTMPVTGRLGRLNFSKFKILQHPDMRRVLSTEADIEPLCAELPFEEIADEHGEIRKAYPTVVRDIIEFNGIAVGFDTAARQAHVLRGGRARSTQPHREYCPGTLALSGDQQMTS